MKKFSFRLESVLRVRKTEEEIAKAKLLEKNQQLAHALIELSDRRDAYEETSSGTVSSTVVSVNDVLAARNRAELSSARLVAAEEALRDAQLAVSSAQADFSSAAARTKAISRLREKAVEEFTLVSQRDEQNELDELASARQLMSSGA